MLFIVQACAVKYKYFVFTSRLIGSVTAPSASKDTHWFKTSHPPLLRIATIEVQIAKLDSEAWPGLLDPERDRLILINEKEELLKELQYVSPRQRLEPNDAEKLESEKKRLERDLQAARDNQSKALTERWEDGFRESKKAGNESVTRTNLQGDDGEQALHSPV